MSQSSSDEPDAPTKDTTAEVKAAEQEATAAAACSEDGVVCSEPLLSHLTPESPTDVVYVSADTRPRGRSPLIGHLRRRMKTDLDGGAHVAGGRSPLPAGLVAPAASDLTHGGVILGSSFESHLPFQPQAAELRPACRVPPVKWATVLQGSASKAQDLHRCSEFVDLSPSASSLLLNEKRVLSPTSAPTDNDPSFSDPAVLGELHLMSGLPCPRTLSANGVPAGIPSPPSSTDTANYANKMPSASWVVGAGPRPNSDDPLPCGSSSANILHSYLPSSGELVSPLGGAVRRPPPGCLPYRFTSASSSTPNDTESVLLDAKEWSAAVLRN